MNGVSIEHLESLLLLLLAGVAALALVAKRIRVAYPIMLVIGGLLLSLLPRVPRVSLDPDIVFLVILPPLVFSAAFHTSWREFRNNLVGIVMLAFGLVGFTVFGVAATASTLIKGFDWKLGLVLGSIVAATDAIAATSTASRLGLSRRITDLLETESLVNDGSGLVALKFTLAMVITRATPSFVQGIGTLSYLVFGAVAVGLVAGIVIHQIQLRIADAPVEITVSLITPYLSYIAAERLGCSGVLATLACGIYLGRRSSGYFSLHARIESSAVWRTLDFILNGLVFLVLGLQLPSILAEVQGGRFGEVFFDAAVVCGVVILLRLLWIFPGEWSSVRLQRFLTHRRGIPLSSKESFLVGWAGMRGVLALAAALALPQKLANGQPFPFRNLIIFLTFCVIFATLVLQGLSMPALIRWLGLVGTPSAWGREEENWARSKMLSAALDVLHKLRRQGDVEDAEIFDELEALYRRRLTAVQRQSEDEEASGDQAESHFLERQRYLAQELRNTERAVVLQLRDSNKIHDEVLRRLEHELDLLDARFAKTE